MGNWECQIAYFISNTIGLKTITIVTLLAAHVCTVGSQMNYLFYLSFFTAKICTYLPLRHPSKQQWKFICAQLSEIQIYWRHHHPVLRFTQTNVWKYCHWKRYKNWLPKQNQSCFYFPASVTCNQPDRASGRLMAMMNKKPFFGLRWPPSVCFLDLTLP